MIWDYEEGDKRPDREERREKITRQLEELREETASPLNPLPCPPRGHICKSFWGRTWCRHLESFSHWDQRLPRGRKILRGGNVYGLTMEQGRIHAYAGSDDLYEVNITVAPLDEEIREEMTSAASALAFSLMDLWEGKLSDTLLEILTCREKGLFPSPEEVRINCPCMDWADVCDHGAAVLYGAGILFEEHPELLFLLRNVSPEKLRDTHPESQPNTQNNELSGELLSDVFGIEIHDI